MSTYTALQCQLLPTKGQILLVPDDLVVEIMRSQAIQPASDTSPEWLAGWITWQHFTRLPIIDFGPLCGMAATPRGTISPSFAILRNLQPAAEDVAYYGLLVGGMAGQALFNEEDLIALDEASTTPYIQHRVEINGVKVAIPDLARLSETLHDLTID